MNIAVDAVNQFQLGWVSCFLGLPPEHPRARTLKDEQVRQFAEGWDLCNGTSQEDRVEAYENLVKAGIVSVIWVDDDNNELKG